MLGSDDSQMLTPEDHVQPLKVVFKTLQNFACILFTFRLRVDMHMLYGHSNVQRCWTGPVDMQGHQGLHDGVGCGIRTCTQLPGHAAQQAVRYESPRMMDRRTFLLIATDG